MTNEEINIAISEHLGWTHCRSILIKPERWEVSDEPEFARIGSRPPQWGAGSCTFPNYCGDLNAMHEAEEFLDNAVRMVYKDQLSRVCLRRCDENSWLISATASQRAEAFLRAVGKWQETTVTPPQTPLS